MTKAEIYEKAWVLAQKNDFSALELKGCLVYV